MDYELFLRFHTRGARFHVVDDVLANMQLGGVSDRKWRLALAELRRAQLENGVPRLHAEANWAFQLAKGGARRWLEAVGAGKLVWLYRRRVALVPKVSSVAPGRRG